MFNLVLSKRVKIRKMGQDGQVVIQQPTSLPRVVFPNLCVSFNMNASINSLLLKGTIEPKINSVTLNFFENILKKHFNTF